MLLSLKIITELIPISRINWLILFKSVLDVNALSIKIALKLRFFINEIFLNISALKSSRDVKYMLTLMFSI
ncbi:hypothetical protein VIBNIPon4_940065 [Vibrio nigripulchritudo POn4]|nr:hypothetical protein VIBNIPon4_940065 [Vibrio nigripulchritudo POn4]